MDSFFVRTPMVQSPDCVRRHNLEGGLSCERCCCHAVRPTKCVFLYMIVRIPFCALNAAMLKTFRE